MEINKAQTAELAKLILTAYPQGSLLEANLESLMGLFDIYASDCCSKLWANSLVWISYIEFFESVLKKFSLHSESTKEVCHSNSQSLSSIKSILLCNGVAEKEEI